MLYCKMHINPYCNHSQPEDKRRLGNTQREYITYAPYLPLISAIKQRRELRVMDDTYSCQKVSDVATIPQIQKPQVDVYLQYMVTGGVSEGETGYIKYKKSVSWCYEHHEKIR